MHGGFRSKRKRTQWPREIEAIVVPVAVRIAKGETTKWHGMKEVRAMIPTKSKSAIMGKLQNLAHRISRHGMAGLGHG